MSWVKKDVGGAKKNGSTELIVLIEEKKNPACAFQGIGKEKKSFKPAIFQDHWSEVNNLRSSYNKHIFISIDTKSLKPLWYFA